MPYCLFLLYLYFNVILFWKKIKLFIPGTFCSGHVFTLLVGGSRAPQYAYSLLVSPARCHCYPSLTSLSQPSWELLLVRSGTDFWLFNRGGRLLFAQLTRWVLPNFGEVILCAGSRARCVELKYKRFVFVFYTGCAGYWARHAELLGLWGTVFWF